MIRYMLEKFRTGLLITAAALLSMMISSCKVAPPVLKSLSNLKVERNGTTGLIVSSEAVIHNPNPVRLRLKDMKLDVAINDKTAASIGKKTNMLIKRNADFTVPFSVEIKSVESVFGDLKSIFGLLKGHEVSFSIKGNLKMRAYCFIRYNFPVQYKQQVKIPQLK